MRMFAAAILFVCSCQVVSAAAVVAPGLPLNYNVDYLAFQATTLAQMDQPSGIGTSLGVVHLGTNTDLFRSYNGAAKYWLRYTLDQSSSVEQKYPCYDCEDPSDIVANTAPVIGALWLSFTATNSGYSIAMNTDKLVKPLGYWFSVFPAFNTDQLAPGQSGVQTLNNVFGSPFACFPEPGTGCEFESSLKLAFLQLSWNPILHRYGLATSATGFDQIYYERAFEFETVTKNLAIAPVPLPASLWLFASGLAGLGAGRFKKRRAL
jgi:hypothetical protein